MQGDPPIAQHPKAIGCGGCGKTSVFITFPCNQNMGGVYENACFAAPAAPAKVIGVDFPSVALRGAQVGAGIGVGVDMLITTQRQATPYALAM